MKSRKIVSALAAGLVVVLTAAFALSQTPSSSADRAITIVRTLNTAQADAMGSQHRYLNLSELPQHRFLANKEWSVQPRNDVEGSVGEYKVVLAVTGDFKHYQLSMIPADPCKSAAVFSNDSGLIYTGQVLGCEK